MENDTGQRNESHQAARHTAPPKKGIPTVVGVLIVVVVIGTIIGGGWAWKDYQLRRPRIHSSEARAALSAMKDRARVVYQRTGKAPTMDDLSLGPTELDGSYHKQADYSCGGDAKHWWAKCVRDYETDPRDLILTADLESGSASFNR